MTTNLASYPARVSPMLPSRQGLDPVRARVTAGHQLTNDQMMQAVEAAGQATEVVHLPRGTHGPHPGDVLYWVTCVGGAGLLLIVATT